MEPKEEEQKKGKNKPKRVIAWSFSVVFLAGVLALLALQLASVQTAAVEALISRYNERSGYQVSVARVHTNWWDKTTLDNLIVKDDPDSVILNRK